MRFLLVRLAGLGLVVYKPDPSTMTVSYRRTGNEAKTYILDHEDFKEAADEYTSGSTACTKQDIDTSAVGFKVRLVKNEGTVTIRYDAKVVDLWTGPLTAWRPQPYMTAYAFTQMDNNDLVHPERTQKCTTATVFQYCAGDQCRPGFS